MSASGSSASLCPESNEQPTGTVPWMCGQRWPTQPAFTPRPTQGAGVGCGAGDGEALEILDSPQSGHCQPPNSAETTQRASVSWPPPGPIPGQGARTGWHRATGEGKMSFHSRSAADPAKVLVPPMYGGRERKERIFLLRNHLTNGSYRISPIAAVWNLMLCQVLHKHRLL